MKTIKLNYEGYWREPNFNGVPVYSGVYSFYECKFNADKTVTLVNLLYIGQAKNCRERVVGHNKLDEMRSSLTTGNVLCVHTAPLNELDKDRSENALIYHHQPPFNDLLKDSFNYDTTSIMCGGRYNLLSQNFTVQRPNFVHRSLFR